MDGDKLSLSYTFNIPENALKDHPTPKTLTYKLPDGIKLTENKDFKLINQSDGNTNVMTVSGKVFLSVKKRLARTNGIKSSSRSPIKARETGALP
jgi:hypothetical protein